MFAKLSYSLLINILSVLTPIITLPIVLRSLGPESYGHYAHSIVFSNWSIAVFVASLSAFCTREYIRKVSGATDAASAPLPFSQLVGLQLVMSLIGTAIHCVVLFVVIQGEVPPVYWVAVLATGLSFLNVDWYFFAIGATKILFWRTLFIRIFSVAAIVVLVDDQNDVILYALIVVGSTVMANLTGFLFACRSEGFSLDVRGLRHLKRAKHFLSSAGIGSVYQFADQFLLGLLPDKSGVAYLSLCKQILNALNIFSISICRVLMPISTAKLAGAGYLRFVKKSLMRYLTALLIVAVVFSLVGQDALGWVAGSQYHFARAVFVVCAACFVVTGLNVFIDTQISIPMRLERFTMIANLFVGATNAAGLVLLVPSMGYVGALCALLLGEVVGLAVALTCHAKKGTLHEIPLHHSV